MRRKHGTEGVPDGGGCRRGVEAGSWWRCFAHEATSAMKRANQKGSASMKATNKVNTVNHAMLRCEGSIVLLCLFSRVEWSGVGSYHILGQPLPVILTNLARHQRPSTGLNQLLEDQKGYVEGSAAKQRDGDEMGRNAHTSGEKLFPKLRTTLNCQSLLVDKGLAA